MKEVLVELGAICNTDCKGNIQLVNIFFRILD